MDSERTRQFVSALAKTHGSSLRRFLAVRMRHSQSDVPDLVQEVFLRLLRIPDHETIRNAQAYLYTIASHVLHQYALRRKATEPVADPTDIVSELEAAVETDPAERVQLEQQFEQLGRGLEQLSPRAYATLVMCRCEGATFEEIGQRLGVSSRMAKKYMAKALSYCQQRLQEME
ncbi:RNA polymerase sigma factor [Steroidobacter sp.]|uniref:RNA polymerase sigma factor n=1 Tax=Steroidobacter sp. TaxID=1978227 RepID=UPI001A418C5F|nr:RNA polymerase sigma factor [Steroidobacter sp.]MBL8268320.1 RNA polymerase sigma factor [Steroidobacter sp.]